MDTGLAAPLRASLAAPVPAPIPGAYAEKATKKREGGGGGGKGGGGVDQAFLIQHPSSPAWLSLLMTKACSCPLG